MRNGRIGSRAAKSADKIRSRDAGDSVMDKHPQFSTQYLCGDYCLSLCDKNHKAAFADTVHKLGRLTWAQIYNSGRHACGFEKIPKKKIRATPPSGFDGKNLIVFRYHARNAMVGYQDGQTFHILWLDRDYTLYNHGS